MVPHNKDIKQLEEQADVLLANKVLVLLSLVLVEAVEHKQPVAMADRHGEVDNQELRAA